MFGKGTEASADIIFAAATHLGRSALHLTRVCGVGCFEQLSNFLLTPGHVKKKVFKIRPESAKPTTKYCLIVTRDNEVIDDVIVTFFPGPHSYCGEDTFEISSHGNPIITSQIHSLLRMCGFRDALPGEFTQRAFLNGKMDLTQAEAVAQLIDAETLGGVTLARRANEGEVTEISLSLRNDLVDSLAYLEAHIDFGPEDVGDFDGSTLLPKLHELERKLNSLAESRNRGRKIQEGLKVALVGAPNAGKSSLYNALLKESRAIVTEIPGTTRDVLIERLVLDRRDFVLLDTAGLRETGDVVEKLGIEKTKKSAEDADVICYVVDVNVEFEQLASSVNHLKITNEVRSQQSSILVLNKSDLVNSADKQKLESTWADQSFTKTVIVNHLNVEALAEALIQTYDEMSGSNSNSRDAVLISQRQFDKVTASLAAVRHACELIESGSYPEKIAARLNEARTSLEELVGEISLDNVFEKIFSTFCIGK